MTAELVHPSPVLLAGAAVIAQIFYPLVYGGARDVLTIASVALFCAASFTHAALTRGARTALVLLGVFAGGGFLVDVLGLATGFPFGSYSYAESLGPALFGVPVVIGLAWTMMAWPSWIAAGLLTSKRWTRIAVAAWGLASWDLFLDPQMVSEGYWRWANPEPGLPGVYGVPLTNHLGWLVVAVLLMAAFDRLGGSSLAPPRREVHRRRDVPAHLDVVPVGLFLWVYFSSILAHTIFFGLPYAALWGAAGMGVVALPLASRSPGRRRQRT